MTINTDRRPRFSKAQRHAILLEHESTCGECGGLITPGQRYAIDHNWPREMSLPGSGADDRGNLRPVHDEAEGQFACHKRKTARDKALIAKSNRTRKHHGKEPPVKMKPPGRKLQGRGFQPGHRPMQSRNNLRRER